jgi:hypothetical protein
MAVTYKPGDTTQLVKANLKATDGPQTSIDVYFNPKEITIDKQVPWQKHKNSEGDIPTLEFTAGEPKTLNVELMYDLFEQPDGKKDVYAEYISKLETLALIDDSLKRPPMCTFTWGSAMPTFSGVVEDLNVKYTLFLPDGTPCRATVTLKMKQSSTLLNKQEAKDAADAEAKQQAGTTPPAGQPPDTTAAAVNGGDPNHRPVSTANNHDDPLNPPPGPVSAPR